MNKFKFEDVVSENKGFLRGPFGGDLKKEIFVPKNKDTYKVYEQGVVLRRDETIGRYHITKEYFDRKMHRFAVKSKDFLVSCSGANYGAIFQLGETIEKGVINQALLRIRLNNEIITDDYFNYLFQHHIVNMIVGKKGDSTIPNFPPISVIKQLEFDLPNLKTQKKVGSFLKTIDTKIEINNKINQELEAMAKTLYDYWFVQFDFPDKNGKPYKSSGGKMIFNEELKREIPVGWENKNIGYYCKSSGGYAFKSSMWSDKGALVVKIKDIQEDYTINLSDISHADLSGKEIDEKFIAKPGDVLIAMTGATVGKYAIVPFTEKPLHVNQRVGYFDLGINPTNKLPFLINSLNQKYFRDQVFKVATGAAQPNISNEQINNIKLVIPTKDSLELYNSNMKSSYDKILNNQRENQKLSELRDWLLPMLMNGQVSFGYAKQEVESLGLVAEEDVKYGKK